MLKKQLTTLLLFIGITAFSQTYAPNWASLNTRPIPAWFQQDKFGIFIHWGVYAVPSYAPVIPNSGESYAEWYWWRLQEKSPRFWAFHQKNYGADFSYPQFEPMFKAELFDPVAWADLFKKSGARYVVLTSKHHEGYCLWNSAEADKAWGRPWNAVTGTPKRDLLGDLTQAVRDKGLRMGYYYSLYEWFNPLWQTDKKKYVDEHMTPQFKDLVNTYKPSIIFSDGEWDLSDTAWKSASLLAWLFNESPVAKEVVVNDRWGKNTREKNKATYATSEYGAGMDASVIWEENQGIGHSYGYNRNEKLADYKSSYDLKLMLVDIVSRGGNLLLDIGPTADGRIPVIMQQRLTDMGDWLSKNGEAIYGTMPYKKPYQWSPGVLPSTSGANYMAGYSVADLIKTDRTGAHIEAFFTSKGKDLYVILPHYVKQFQLRSYSLPAGAKVSLLGCNTQPSVKQKGENLLIDLSVLRLGEVDPDLLVLKISNGIR